jgi:Reverse transcriptase (RNA-dependent DNA polymerase)
VQFKGLILPKESGSQICDGTGVLRCDEFAGHGIGRAPIELGECQNLPSLHKNSLPQGSPCSPVISNYIGHILDIQSAALAAKHSCTYSRYADDLTFSTNEGEFPVPIAKINSTNPHIVTAGADSLG